jgi:tetratricopeptide (TPR) repeat protein
MIGQALSSACPFFFMSRSLSPVLISVLFPAFIIGSFAQTVSTPKTAESSLAAERRAIALAHSGHCEEALPLLRRSGPQITDRAIKREGGFALVQCAMALDQRDAAVDALRSLSREFPRDPEVFYITVHTYSDISSRAAQQLATTAPDSPSAHQLLAESFEMQGKWDEAAGEYHAILKAHPQLPGLHFRLGRLLLSKPNPGPSVAEEAKKEMQLELAVDPGNAGAEYILGELARQGQQWDDAIGHFAQASKLDVSFSDAYLGLGASLLQKKRFPEAVPPLETAVKLEPRNPDAHYNLAMAYSRVGRKQDAEKEFAVHRRMTQGAEGGPGTTPGPASGSQPPQNP